MGNIYNTQQISEITGVPAATLRSWKHRGKLKEGIHWGRDERDDLVWTDSGLQEVQSLAGQSGNAASLKIADSATDSNAVETQGDDTAPDAIAQFADAVAWATIEARLPGQVQCSINRILQSPTALDQERLLALLGRVGSGVTLARMSAIFANGCTQAIAASQASLQLMGGGSDEAP